jgi:hypothetical protein
MKVIRHHATGEQLCVRYRELLDDDPLHEIAEMLTKPGLVSLRPRCDMEGSARHVESFISAHIQQRSAPFGAHQC